MHLHIQFRVQALDPFLHVLSVEQVIQLLHIAGLGVEFHRINKILLFEGEMNMADAYACLDEVVNTFLE